MSEKEDLDKPDADEASDDEEMKWECPKCHNVNTRFKCIRCGTKKAAALATEPAKEGAKEPPKEPSTPKEGKAPPLTDPKKEEGHPQHSPRRKPEEFGVSRPPPSAHPAGPKPDTTSTVTKPTLPRQPSTSPRQSEGGAPPRPKTPPKQAPAPAAAPKAGGGAAPAAGGAGSIVAIVDGHVRMGLTQEDIDTLSRGGSSVKITQMKVPTSVVSAPNAAPSKSTLNLAEKERKTTAGPSTEKTEKSAGASPPASEKAPTLKQKVSAAAAKEKEAEKPAAAPTKPRPHTPPPEPESKKEETSKKEEPPAHRESKGKDKPTPPTETPTPAPAKDAAPATAAENGAAVWREYNSAQLCDALKKQHVPDSALAHLKEHNVTGATLAEMNQSDKLKQYGVKSFVERYTIWKVKESIFPKA